MKYWTTELFRLLGRESLCVSIVHVALLLGRWIQDSIKLSYRIVSLIGAWKLLCFNSTCCSAYWGSIQASRDNQTELQNCFAYWGVKAHIFHSACCSASWGMNPRFKRYSNWATELFRLWGRESLCVSIVHVALLIEDESKLQEIFKLNYRIVWLIGAWRLIYFIIHVALLLGAWIQDSRDIQTELQNCFAYWGVKAYVFQ